MQHRIRRFYLARNVIAGREFHEVEMNALKRMIAAGDVVADIGANVGAYTKHFSTLVGPSGRVHAFEPVAANYDILQTVARKGRLQNVQLHRLALGSSLEQREIAIPDLGGFTGYYWAHFAKPGERGEKVTVSTLDHLLNRKEIQRLDFIKCDVEGSEFEVLNGGSELLRTQRPAWLIEVSRETSGAVFSTLQQQGYRAFVYDGVLRPTDGYLDRQFSNYFFFHPETKIWSRWHG
jgi:FkbM family methyltransferase